MHEIAWERAGPILDIANLNVRCLIKNASLLASHIRQAIRGTSAVLILQSSRPTNRGKRRRVRGNFDRSPRKKNGFFHKNTIYHLRGEQSNSLALSNMRPRMNGLDIIFGSDTYSRLRETGCKVGMCPPPSEWASGARYCLTRPLWFHYTHPSPRGSSGASCRGVHDRCELQIRRVPKDLFERKITQEGNEHADFIEKNRIRHRSEQGHRLRSRPPVLSEMKRVLRSGGLLLLAFHVGDEVVHFDELWGQAVALDFAA